MLSAGESESRGAGLWGRREARTRAAAWQPRAVTLWGVSDQCLHLASLALPTTPALQRAPCQQEATGTQASQGGDGCLLASREKHSKESRPINLPGGLGDGVNRPVCADPGEHWGSLGLAVCLTHGETEARVPHCLSWARPGDGPWFWADPGGPEHGLPLHFVGEQQGGRRV